MKRTMYAVVVLLLTTISMNAQQSINLDLVVKSTNKISNTNIGKGKEFTINSVTCDMSSQKGYNYILGVTGPDGKNYQLNLAKAHQMPICYNNADKDGYWYARSIEYTLPSLASMNNAYAMRNKAEVTANQYVTTLRDNSLILDDPYLTSYINSLLIKINPSQRLDFFKYNFRVVIVKDIEPNAGIYPNGALVINAGMLARIHTEDELIALLCHEANHFICNHYLENLEKIQKREVASAIGSAVLGTAAGLLSHSAGIGLSTSSLSLDMASSLNSLITTMGLAFDQSQEKESDQAAVDLLPILGYDQNAMATCISRIGQYYMEEGNLAAYYKSGSHPKIEDRIAATGVPYDTRDAEFEKKMAPCVNYVSMVLYNKGRYAQAIDFAEQNINNGAGRGTDYYIKGECLLATQDSEESNTLARESMLKCLEIYPNDLSAMKGLIISDVRLGMKDEARVLLTNFKELAKDKAEERTWADGMLMNIAQ